MKKKIDTYLLEWAQDNMIRAYNEYLNWKKEFEEQNCVINEED